jgi:hypothetical protein
VCAHEYVCVRYVCVRTSLCIFGRKRRQCAQSI